MESKYHSTKKNLEGNLEGILPTSYYYVTLKNKYAMHQYEPLSGAFFNREFPTSWRQIDSDVDVSAVVMDMKNPDGEDEEGNEGDFNGQLYGQNLEQDEDETEGKLSDFEKIEDEDSDGNQIEEGDEENKEENSVEESIQ
jgi:hypothetical protein